ncbi:hypothetical protein [Altererythrobacter rubellus]|uniref:Uncharacterized protein n=1 Tax=Altererythrobacter rubellus TaxID=2173831 RepID=A0A9Y2BAF1_9SPHN|nr:hypothetical protein [Altererythrobacter rubellus]WIW95945.1 hypothetical protein QQX03_02225 [Altererythrobacter rubellus]
MGQKFIQRDLKTNQFIMPIVLGAILFFMGSIFLKTVGYDAIFNNSFFQFFADSNTYHELYETKSYDVASLIGVQNNLVGPLLILSIAQGNLYAVLFQNIIIFIASIILICKSYSINTSKTAILILLLSPMMVSSLLSVNKEIISFLVISIIIYSLRFQKVQYFAIALIISLMVRWQMSAFCILLAIAVLLKNYRRVYFTLLMLILLSLIFYYSQSFLSPVLDRVDFYNLQYTDGSGVFEALGELQKNGFYFIVSALKAAHLLFSMGTKLSQIINPYNFYNDTIQGLHSLSNIFLFFLLLVRRKIDINNDLIFISIIYCAVFCLTPVYAPRYLFPVTILWILALIVDKSKADILFNGQSVVTGRCRLPASAQ